MVCIPRPYSVKLWNTKIQLRVFMNFKDFEKQVDSEYNHEKSTKDFIEWVTQTNKQTRAYGNEELKKSPIIKRLREEALPVRTFLELHTHSYESILLIDGSQQYDGVLKGKNSNHIEITCVKDGQYELFQAQHMDRFDHAPNSGVKKEDIKEAVNKNDWGDLPVDEQGLFAEVEMVQEKLEELDKQVVVAINKKVSKEYPADTILLVSVDDGSLVEDHHFAQLCEKVKSQLHQKTFSEIFMVSVNDKRIHKLA